MTSSISRRQFTCSLKPNPERIAVNEKLSRIGKDLPGARRIAAKARDTARHAMAAMVANIA